MHIDPAEFSRNLQAGIEFIFKLLPALYQFSEAQRQQVSTRLDWEAHLTEYLKTSLTRVGFTKVVLFKDQPLKVEQVYEPLDMTYVDSKGRVQTIHSVDSDSLQKVGRAILVKATAGAGKTTLLKHFFLDALDRKTRWPVLIELRRLNQTGLRIIDLLNDSMHLQGDPVHSAIFFLNFDTLLLVDGFDEIETDRRSDILTELASIIDRFPRAVVVITSRPDPALESQRNLSIAKPLPLRFEQALSLIQRVPRFDEDTRAKFLDHFTEAFFKEFYSFASNPLLLSIMMLTFADAATIEKKKSRFYHDAYLALYSRHDATKESFSRALNCGLDRDEFERILEAFCIQTFVIQQRSLSSLALSQVIEKCKEMTAINFSSEHLLADLLQSVCILTLDGLIYTYTHRSFEEYFAAKFIANRTDEHRKALVKVLTERSIRDNVCVQILYELKPYIVEKEILLPAIHSVLLSEEDLTESVLRMTWTVWTERAGSRVWRPGLKLDSTYEAYLVWLLDELGPLFGDRPVTDQKIGEFIHEAINVVVGKGGFVCAYKEFRLIVGGDGGRLVDSVLSFLSLSFADVQWLHNKRRQLRDSIAAEERTVMFVLEKASAKKVHRKE